MSIQVGAHSLPSISPLPPIEMPDSSSSPPSPRQTPDHDRFSLIGRSSTSLLSQNSFTTALSSSPVEPTRPASQMYLPAPPCLRKSISVDSLARQDVPRTNTRPKRTNTDLTMPVPVIQQSRSRNFDRQASQVVTRSREVSFSSEYDPSVAEDSDIEPWPSSRRRSLLKGKEQQQPCIRPGELKLPPRMPALSLASSISTISTAPSSPREEPPRCLHATTSLQSIPARMANPPLANLSGRARSGSLGVKVASVRPSLINTRLSSKPLGDNVDPVTIAVVGAPGTGKSTVVHKGTKQFGLSDSTVLSAPPGMLGVQASLRYVRRIGLVTEIEILEKTTPSCPLHVLEVDIAHLGWEQSMVFSSGDSSAGAPQIDGVLICYDASTQSSFKHVEDLMKRLRILKLPFIVLACKSDLERQVDPELVLELLTRYDSGLVEASKESKMGRDKMRQSFEWLIIAILRERRRSSQDPDYRNPASPDNLGPLPPWENPKAKRSSIDSSKAATPTTASTITSTRTVVHSQGQAKATSSRLQQASTMPTIPSSRPPSVPTSPTRARSTSDLLFEHEKARNQGRLLDGNGSGRNSMLTLGIGGSVSSDQLHTPANKMDETEAEEAEAILGSKEPETKQSRPAQWATLEELLDKLLFLAVSGDDSAFLSNFLLTYRRFATPRSVLVAMQKRIRLLDSPSGDPMFACYAQMRICHLLEQWIQDYPYDFSVGRTPDALKALVSSIVSKTYLLHYGCDFMPFNDTVTTLQDKDAVWALPAEESDDSYSVFDEEEELPVVNGVDYSTTNGTQSPPSIVVSSRERRLSLPLAVTVGRHDQGPNTVPFSTDDAEFKKFLKDLVKNSQEISVIDSNHIAEEITRIEAKYFLEIEPRHWLHYTLVSGKKDPESSTIARFNAFSNHLAEWVVSLILCHDRPKNRARQIEKFVEIAQRLRGLNNYSALRAFVAGINNSTFLGDATMDIFMNKTPELSKTFRSWDILLQAVRSHRAYRMALKSSKGACIPALEVHMSDLIRAHEGNTDFHPDNPNKIHWGKFNMIGKFVNSTTQCQIQCRNAPEYNFPERPYIIKLISHPVMDSEMQRSRIAPPPEEPPVDPVRPRTYSRDTPKESPNIVRKFFSW